MAVAIMAPVLVDADPAGLGSIGSVLLFAFLAYLSLLVGLAVFLVVLLPLGPPARCRGVPAPGWPRFPYLPIGALLILAITGFAVAGAVAQDGLPDGALGLVFMVIGVLGVEAGSVRVTSPGWLLVARVAGVAVVGCAVGLWVVGKRSPSKAS